MADLVLASTSTYRRDLLQRLRVPFSCVAPGVDEAALKATRLDPMALAAELAQRKARAVAARHPGAIVIGSDQVATIDGEVLDKPGTAARAVAQLQRLQGQAQGGLGALLSKESGAGQGADHRCEGLE